MKIRARAACISAAVAAVSFGVGAQARELQWDWSAGDGVAHDGGETWSNGGMNWVDIAAPGTNVAWDGTPAAPDSAIFGTDSAVGVEPTTPWGVGVASDVHVQNITFAPVAAGNSYEFFNLGGPLTLHGNLIKSAGTGSINFFVNTDLTAGDHRITLRDTGGPAPEMKFNGVITGAGGITLDNDAYEAWGTVTFNQANSYGGVTNINKGRIVLTNEQGLGNISAGTVIGAIGTLGIGGAETTVGPMTITEPLTITRNTYAGGDFGLYRSAINVANDGSNDTHTIAGPLVIDSNDARIAVDTNTLVISSNIAAGPNVTPELPAVLTLDGDFAGFVTLTGNNAGLAAGGVRIMGGVELNVSNHNNLGGPNAPITFNGGTFHPVGGFMTSFGSHPINNATFNGGLDVDAGQTFTIDQALGRPLGDATEPVGSIGKRGAGTLNLNSPINLRGGSTYWDAGVVNVNSNVELQSLHLRSSVVNIPAGGSVTAFANNNVFGESSTGTNGGPDKAVVNIDGGSFTQQATGDFFVSDGANTEGTINLNSGTLTANGLVHVARNAGAKGTINQTGGTFNLTRDGNFTLVLGSRNGLGTYNLGGGTMNSEGEFYVGQGAAGVGVFNMTGGTVNLDHWFVVGREGGAGTVDMSGGVFNKTRGGTHTEVDVGGGAGPSTMTLRNNAHYNAVAGDMRVGVGGGGNGTLTIRDSAILTVAAGEIFVGQGTGTGVMTVQDSASVTVNNWFAIGREGGNGTVNLSGNATITKGGGGGSRIVIGAPVNRNDAVGVLNQTGGTLTNTVSETWINEAAASGTWNFSGGTANLADFHVGQAGGATSSATLNMSGTSALNANVVRLNLGGEIASTINLDGGTLSANQIVAGGGNGAKTLNLNGGVLKPRVTNTTDWMNGALAVNVKAGGAKFDTSGFDARVNPALLHDAALGATPDGGLTKTGAGTLTLAGANTYTGGTNVQAGTLQVTRMHENNPVNITAGKLQVLDSSPTLPLHPSGDNAFVSRPSSFSIANNGGAIGARTYNGQLDLTNNDLILDYDGASPIADIEDMVRAGFNGGNWLGNGITSSTANANSNFAVGVADNARLTNKYGAARPFSGQTVDDTTILVKFTHRIDLDLDGVITTNDATIFNSNYTEGQPAYWSIGDLDYDRVFTTNDATLFNSFYSEALASVPEPAALGVLGVAAIGLLGRRGRRSTCAAEAV